MFSTLIMAVSPVFAGLQTANMCLLVDKMT